MSARALCHFVIAATAAVFTLPASAAACWPELPAGWSGVLRVGHVRDAVVAERAVGIHGGMAIQAGQRMNIASLGKMFTAVAIGQLVDAGRVRFEAPIGAYLPELPEAFRALTIAQLLTHTAGLGSYLEEQPLQRVDAARTARALVPLATAQAPRDIGIWRYSNSSFALAAAVVEAVSGQDFESYLQSRVFAPAGMTQVRFAPEPGDLLPTVVAADGSLQQPPIGRMRGGPAGGAFATAEDLHRFARALLDGRLLQPTTAERMTSLQHEFTPRRADGIARGWGYGFGVSGQAADRSFGHTGGIPGGAAALRVRAADGRVTVMLSPQDRVDPPPAAGLMAVDPAACQEPLNQAE